MSNIILVLIITILSPVILISVIMSAMIIYGVVCGIAGMITGEDKG